MPRVALSQAEKDLTQLVDQVRAEGITFDLSRGEEVLARLVPAEPRPRLLVRDLNAFLQGLPKLGDDAGAFAEDVQAIRREFPAEANPWD